MLKSITFAEGTVQFFGTVAIKNWFVKLIPGTRILFPRPDERFPERKNVFCKNSNLIDATENVLNYKDFTAFF
jgi:hypothetical protein